MFSSTYILSITNEDAASCMRCSFRYATKLQPTCKTNSAHIQIRVLLDKIRTDVSSDCLEPEKNMALQPSPKPNSLQTLLEGRGPMGNVPNLGDAIVGVPADRIVRTNFGRQVVLDL